MAGCAPIAGAGTCGGHAGLGGPHLPAGEGSLSRPIDDPVMAIRTEVLVYQKAQRKKN